LLHFIERIVDKVENLRIRPVFVALFFCSLVSLRAVLEQWFFEDGFSIYQFMHHFYFFSVILAGILLISYVGGIEVLKVTRIVSSGLFLIILPPLIDRVILGRTVPYEYVQPSEFLNDFVSFYVFNPKAGKGIFIELAAMILLSGFYVWLKSRSIHRSIATGLLLYVLIGLYSAPRLFLPLPGLGDEIFFLSRHIVFFFLFFLLSLILGVLFLYRVHKLLPHAIWSELRSFRTLHAILMVNAGVHFNPNLKFFYFPDLIYVFISTTLMTLLWLNAVLVNNVFDLEIDRITNPKRPLVLEKVQPELYLGLSAVISVVMLLTTLVLGLIPFILALLSVLSSLAYSVPPLRLRRWIFSTVFIGWGSVLAFFFGYFSHSSLDSFHLSSEALLVGGLIFVTFSIGPLTKDLKDYAGDEEQGIRTLFTVYGIEKGSWIVTWFLGASMLMPVLLFHKTFDILIIGTPAVVFPVLFLKKKRLRYAVTGYFAVFAYCALRTLGTF
jgi:4-hydroxybenzoate polyprenyltransferase